MLTDVIRARNTSISTPFAPCVICDIQSVVVRILEGLSNLTSPTSGGLTFNVELRYKYILLCEFCPDTAMVEPSLSKYAGVVTPLIINLSAYIEFENTVPGRLKSSFI